MYQSAVSTPLHQTATLSLRPFSPPSTHSNFQLPLELLGNSKKKLTFVAKQTQIAQLIIATPSFHVNESEPRQLPLNIHIRYGNNPTHKRTVRRTNRLTAPSATHRRAHNICAQYTQNLRPPRSAQRHRPRHHAPRSSQHRRSQRSRQNHPAANHGHPL